MYKVLLLAFAISLLATRETSEAPSLVRSHEVGLVQQLRVAQNDLERVRLLRLLPAYSDAAAIPVVAPLLAEPDLLLRCEAVRALQQNPSPSAGAALAAALDQARDKEPEWKIALLQALSARHEVLPVASFSDFLADADPRVAQTAAATLGRLGGTEGAAALKEALARAPEATRPGFLCAYLDCADELVAANNQTAALPVYQEAWNSGVSSARVRGLLGQAAIAGNRAMPQVLEALRDPDSAVVAAGLRAIRTLPRDRTVTAGALQALAGLPPTVQSLLWYVLAARGDPAVLPAALEALKTPDPAVKRAVLWTIGTHGDTACLQAVLPLAANEDGEIQAEARRTLRRLRGKSVDQALLDLLPKSDARTQIEVLGALADRGVAEVKTPCFTLAASSEDPGVRAAVFAVLRLRGNANDLAALVALIQEGVRPGDEEEAAQVGAILCRRGPNPAVGAALIAGGISKTGDTRAKALFLKMLGLTNQLQALPILRQAASAPDPAVRDAGIRALLDWPDAQAVPDLLTIARSTREEQYAILAVRSLIRLLTVIPQPADQLKLWRELKPLARRKEEALWLVWSLHRVASPEALGLLHEYLASPDKAFRYQAAGAALAIAKNLHGDMTRPEVKEAVQAAMKKVLETAPGDERIRQKAQEILEKCHAIPAAVNR